MPEADTQTHLTPLDKIITVLLILGLVGIGAAIVLVKMDVVKSPFEKTAAATAPKPTGETAALPGVEAADTAGLTTVKEYKYVPGEKLPARIVGDMVIAGLKELDQIAYIRYAIVYLHLDDLRAIRQEIDRLLEG